MNNKKIGSDWERKVCKYLAQKGYWVHFIVPDARGAQPFDIIAVRYGTALAIDCKTCVANTFNISRLEDNQISSFDLWLRCGNHHPMIAVYHKNKLYWIEYEELKKRQSIRLDDCYVDEDYRED